MATNRIEKAWESMISNLQQKTGKSLADWIEIINLQSYTKTSDKVKYLKSTYGLVIRGLFD